MDSLFYEYVNDRGVRERLRASHGFCNWHAWMATTIEHCQSGIALLYEHLLQDQIVSLRAFRNSVRPWSWLSWLRAAWQTLRRRPDLLDVRRRRATCPACARLDLFFEQHFVATLVAHLGEEAFREGFRLSFGLCLPHLYQAIASHRDHPNLPVLLDLELQKLSSLRGELNEYLRKLDYRCLAEPRGDEQTAWRRVIELFAGKPQVFGPDRASGAVRDPAQWKPATAAAVETTDPTVAAGTECNAGHAPHAPAGHLEEMSRHRQP